MYMIFIIDHIHHSMNEYKILIFAYNSDYYKGVLILIGKKYYFQKCLRMFKKLSNWFEKIVVHTLRLAETHQYFTKLPPSPHRQLTTVGYSRRRQLTAEFQSLHQHLSVEVPWRKKRQTTTRPSPDHH